jgi:predicted nucleotidyltransferase component of viral defense system
MSANSAEFLYDVKRRVILAIFSDDVLMNLLVLKGGNLLDLVYKVSTRTSTDVDLSMALPFDDLEDAKARFERSLRDQFSEVGLVLFDFKMQEVPQPIPRDAMDFWGGYQITFKLVRQAVFERWSNDPQKLRIKAEALTDAKRDFCIDISKFEYCDRRQEELLDGFTVYCYPPEVFVCEKIRAICQQNPAYNSITHSHTRPRPKDFVDLYHVLQKFSIDFTSQDFQETLRAVFHAKRVPFNYLSEIAAFRDFHASTFHEVKATTHPDVVLREFSFYFDWLLKRLALLEALWNE